MIQSAQVSASDWRQLSGHGPSRATYQRNDTRVAVNECFGLSSIEILTQADSRTLGYFRVPISLRRVTRDRVLIQKLGRSGSRLLRCFRIIEVCEPQSRVSLISPDELSPEENAIRALLETFVSPRNFCP